jgi:type I restriction enzyme M protein
MTDSKQKQTRQKIRDTITGIELLAGDEEALATQPLLKMLLERGWSAKQIQSRPQWRVPARPSDHTSEGRKRGFPVDIAIFDSEENIGNPDALRIICECKKPNEKDGIGQLKDYMSHEPEVRLGIWFNGLEFAFVYRDQDGFHLRRNRALPRPSDALDKDAISPLKLVDLQDPPSLKDIFSKIRNYVASKDSKGGRDEFILENLGTLLIAKIVDERDSDLFPERELEFQAAKDSLTTTKQITNWVMTVRQRYKNLFAQEREALTLDPNSIDHVVKSLQNWRLLGHDRLAVGKAFETLKGRAIKGQEGQYFTPPQVVQAAVRLTNPLRTDFILDPACGTGGFLAAALGHVYDQFEQSPSSRVGEYKRHWANHNLLGIDKDDLSIRFCKAYLTLLGDGEGPIYRNDSINQRLWKDDPSNINNVVQAEGFDVILTNPPFGSNLKVAVADARAEQFTFAQKWSETNNTYTPTAEYIDAGQQIGVVFLERCLKLLKLETGRLAIILPETFFFSKGFKWLSDYLIRNFTITHLMNVPMVAFEEFCRAKTILLVLKKQLPNPEHQVICSHPETLGFDKRGKTLLDFKTGEIDDEMSQAVEYITRDVTPPKGKERLYFKVQQSSLGVHRTLSTQYLLATHRQAEIVALAENMKAELISLGQLVQEGSIQVTYGHGSPSPRYHGTGTVPYIKVIHLKNWRINEDPNYFVPQSVAEEFWGFSQKQSKDQRIQAWDLLTPTRASKNIGHFVMTMPWQTNVVLTKEIMVLRVKPENTRGLTPFALQGLFSLKQVIDQYDSLVLMQTNREDLGDRWKEVLIPISQNQEKLKELSKTVQTYFNALVAAQLKVDDIGTLLGQENFYDRPV